MICANRSSTTLHPAELSAENWLTSATSRGVCRWSANPPGPTSSPPGPTVLHTDKRTDDQTG
ncbi:MAG: hypothetical protein IT499_08395 [Rubrivivax sp.]|nr:hypothetical protein [Rubrivivax sp.]NUP87268.1 hypothetical protein [Burkholderiaceae bacterium]